MFGSVRTKNRFFWPTKNRAKNGSGRLRGRLLALIGRPCFGNSVADAFGIPRPRVKKPEKKREMFWFNDKTEVCGKRFGKQDVHYIYIYIGTSLTLQHLHDSLPFKTCTFGVDGFFPNNFPGRFGGWVPCFLVHHGGP